MALQSQRVSGTILDSASAIALSLNSSSKTPREIGTVVGEHPEGHKRGGYVPVYRLDEARVYWDEGACQWFAYDDVAF